MFAPNSPAFAVTAQVVTRIVTNPLTGIAIDGFDPVSYFTEGLAHQGSPDFELSWGGVSWYFSSEANREVFRRNPDVYAPQYGGHGAMSVARGYLSDGNPHIFAVYQSRLYLFYSTGNRDAFMMAPLTALEQANGNWPKLHDQLTAK